MLIYYDAGQQNTEYFIPLIDYRGLQKTSCVGNIVVTYGNWHANNGTGLITGDGVKMYQNVLLNKDRYNVRNINNGYKYVVLFQRYLSQV
jgi:hypothetical protein